MVICDEPLDEYLGAITSKLADFDTTATEETAEVAKLTIKPPK